MKKVLFILAGCLILNSLFAQENNNLIIYNLDELQEEVLIDEIDSITFEDLNGVETMNIFRYGDLYLNKAINDVDSMLLSKKIFDSEDVMISFSGTTATLSNPQIYNGVSITKSGADVVIHSTTDKIINYVLSGTTSNGSVKIYSDYRFNLTFNGVEITNPDGPAINIQSGKRINVLLADGCSNSLIDGSSYMATNDQEEDQKGAFFSEGQLIFSGTGSLTLQGNNKHALCCDDYILVNSGTITVLGAVGDGIHTNEKFIINNGMVNITSSGDGIDCAKGFVEIYDGSLTVNSVDDAIVSSNEEADTTISSYITIYGGTITTHSTTESGMGLKSDGEITIQGGTLDVTTAGKDAKGIKSNGNLFLAGGEITLKSTGAAGMGIKADANMIISGGTIDITTITGLPYYADAAISTSKGISVDSNFTMTGGDLTITNSCKGAKGIKCDGTIILTNGNVTVKNTGAFYQYTTALTSSPMGIKAETLNIQGGSINISTTGVSGHCIKSDGIATISGGSFTLKTTATSAKGLKTMGNLTMNDGCSFTINTSSDAGEGIESKKTLTINGGTFVINTYDDGINAASSLIINGGSIYSYATNNDAIDSNGTLTIKGGLIVASGTNTPEEGFDCDQNTFTITGGTLVGIGGASSIPTASTTTQCVAVINLGVVTSGQIIHIQSAAGTDVLTFKSPRAYNASTLLFSNSGITTGTTYSIYKGGAVSASTSEFHGLYTGASYSDGTFYSPSYTQSSTVFSNASSGGGPGGGGGDRPR